MIPLKGWLLIIAFLAFLGTVGTAKYLYDDNQTLKQEKAILEAKNAQITKTANKYANKPKSDDDVIDRVCAWRERILEVSDGKPKRGVPIESCP